MGLELEPGDARRRLLRRPLEPRRRPGDPAHRSRRARLDRGARAARRARERPRRRRQHHGDRDPGAEPTPATASRGVAATASPSRGPDARREVKCPFLTGNRALCYPSERRAGPCLRDWRFSSPAGVATFWRRMNGARSSNGMAVPPKTQVFTVIVVSDHSQAVRKFRVPRRWLKNAAYAGGGRGARRAPHDRPLLRPPRLLLRERGPEGGERAAPLADPPRPGEGRAHLRDPRPGRAVRREAPHRRDAAAGPRAEPRHRPGRRAPSRTPPSPARRPPARRTSPPCPGSSRSLETEASRQEQSLRELQEYFDDQRSLLASTPSIWPTRGWVTSDFGTRIDPYTAERKMHQGMDIATPHGQPVYTPSDGTVVFAGTEGGYGKVLVIDHGYGVKTRYGHLSEIHVHLGRPREARRQGRRGREHRALHRAAPPLRGARERNPGEPAQVHPRVGAASRSSGAPRAPGARVCRALAFRLPDSRDEAHRRRTPPRARRRLRPRAEPAARRAAARGRSHPRPPRRPSRRRRPRAPAPAPARPAPPASASPAPRRRAPRRGAAHHLRRRRRRHARLLLPGRDGRAPARPTTARTSSPR